MSVPTIESVGDRRPVKVDLVSTYSLDHAGILGESFGVEAMAGDVMGAYGLDSVRLVHTDLQLTDNLASAATHVASHAPHIVGVSVKIGALSQLDDFIRVLRVEMDRQGLPSDTTLILGGVVPTFAADELARRYPGVLVSEGHGEPVLRALIDAKRTGATAHQIPGIHVLAGDDVFQTPRAHHDLSKAQVPARLTTAAINAAGGTIWAETSRGCDGHCTFCSVRALHEHGFVGTIPVETIVEDMRRLGKIGVELVQFSDDDFIGDPARSEAIARELLDITKRPQFTISTRADDIIVVRTERNLRRFGGVEGLAEHNRRLSLTLEALKKAGLVRVFLGMESFSPTQLKRYGKGLTPMQNYAAILELRRMGIDVAAGYIGIDHLMSLQELYENLEALEATGMNSRVTNPVSVLRIQEGSAYKRMMENQGLLGPRTEELVFYEGQFQDPRVQKVAQLAKAWEGETLAIIFGLKTFVQARIGSGQDLRDPDNQAVYHLLNAFKTLDLHFIKSITNTMLANGDTNLDRILGEFRRQRDSLVSEVVVMNQRGLFEGAKIFQEALKQYE